MKKLILAVAAALCAGVASADATVYETTGVNVDNAGNQAYGQMLGLDFEVQGSSVWVTHLGAFDDHQKGLISTDISVGLFDLTTGTSVINPISFLNAVGDPGVSNYIYQNLNNPVLLTLGHQYSVQAFGFNSTDRNYNTNIAPEINNGSNAQSTSPITFNSFGGQLYNLDSRYGGTSMGYGTAFAHSSAFGAGTLTVSAVPEPETYAMLLAGLGALSFVGRRRGAAGRSRREHDAAA